MKNINKKTSKINSMSSEKREHLDMFLYMLLSNSFIIIVMIATWRNTLEGIERAIINGE